MKPSWQVMKLMLAYGRRPLHSYRSLRAATAAWRTRETVPPSPFQNRRTLSRYLPFHSVHSDGEVADLVAAVADVPRLGDQLHLREHRVLVDDVEERAQLVDLVQLAGQRAGQVEAEPVDVHLRAPSSAGCP